MTRDDLPPQWAPDPTGRHAVRFWDGSRWTAHVMDGQVPALDPPSGAAATGTRGRLLPWWGHLLATLFSGGLWLLVAPAARWSRRGSARPALAWAVAWAALIAWVALAGGADRPATTGAAPTPDRPAAASPVPAAAARGAAGQASQAAPARPDPRFGTCTQARANGFGPYWRGQVEYSWYQDADGDGLVCE